MSKLLLIIDMQDDFFQKGRLATMREQMAISLNELLSAFRQNRHNVIWVRQVFKDDLSDSYLALRGTNQKWTIEGTSGCEFLPELIKVPNEVEIIKKRYSAFFGTELDSILSANPPDEIIIAGVNTHACVRVTAIDAYQRDYKLVFAQECLDSYDQSFHDESFKYMVNSGIATPMSNKQIVAELKS